MSALILMGGLWADLAGIDATHAHQATSALYANLAKPFLKGFRLSR